MSGIIKRIALMLAIFFTAGVLFSAPAAAQASRTWISGVGDDANPCSRTAPCKTFAGAISKTAAGGQIDCLDPGGFGGVTITKSLTIDCSDVFGSILVASTNGININGAGINVKIIGLELEGLADTGFGGLSGIKVFQANTVSIANVRIKGFNVGVEVAPTTAGGTVKLALDNVLIVGGISTTGSGISITPGSVNASVNASISNTRVLNQLGTGLAVNTAGGSGAVLTVSATSSVFSGGTSGIIAKATPGTGTINLTVAHSTANNNSLVGAQLNGAGVTAQFSGTTITGNTTGLGLQNTPTVTTFGDNILRQNGTNGAFPAAPVAKQ